MIHYNIRFQRYGHLRLQSDRKKGNQAPNSTKLKKMKKGVDFPKLECYYKQAVTETTAKLQIRHHRRNQKL